MKRVIIADTSLDLNDHLAETLQVKWVPFFLDIEDRQFIDDEDLDIDEYIKAMRESSEIPKTAAPTPEEFYKAIGDNDEAFIVTISSKLSATYNNAMIAKQMKDDENTGQRVHVFDSLSASAGETVVATYIRALLDENKTFDEIVERVEEQIDEMTTMFVLNDLSNLIKNGRMSKIAGKIANLLNITPVCIGVKGEIEVAAKARGSKAAYNRLIKLIVEGVENPEQRTMVISHVKNLEAAERLKSRIEEKVDFKDIQIAPTKGLSSTYADYGGIVVAY